MESFKKYYKFPLRIDEYCQEYIWTDDDQMALNYLDERKLYKQKDTAEITAIVNVINGEGVGNFDASISLEESDIIQINGEDKLMIRGWGNLTGTGCHNLKPEEAIKIQNDFAKWIVEQLRKNL